MEKDKEQDDIKENMEEEQRTPKRKFFKYKLQDVQKDLMSPTKHLELDEKGRKRFKKCKTCNRPILGHDDDGYGMKECDYE